MEERQSVVRQHKSAKGYSVAVPKIAGVVKVGDGRGFIIRYRSKFQSQIKATPTFIEHRLVITAAHCLPKIPPAHALASSWDRTYKLLGSLDGTKDSIATECLFVNPVADIAVLGCPDGQELPEDGEAYEGLTENAPYFRIGPAKSGLGSVLTLDLRWIDITLDVFTGLRGSSLVIDPTERGMSGSPVLNEAGEAVGVVVIGTGKIDSKTGHRVNERSGPQPMLTRDLPGWLL